ncbi:MAG: hypothetical protein Q9162_001771 [Coniocarpon cinnabarinum]
MDLSQLQRYLNYHQNCPHTEPNSSLNHACQLTDPELNQFATILRITTLLIHLYCLQIRKPFLLNLGIIWSLCRATAVQDPVHDTEQLGHFIYYAVLLVGLGLLWNGTWWGVRRYREWERKNLQEHLRVRREAWARIWEGVVIPEHWKEPRFWGEKNRGVGRVNKLGSLDGSKKGLEGGSVKTKEVEEMEMRDGGLSGEVFKQFS